MSICLDHDYKDTYRQILSVISLHDLCIIGKDIDFILF